MADTKVSTVLVSIPFEALLRCISPASDVRRKVPVLVRKVLAAASQCVLASAANAQDPLLDRAASLAKQGDAAGAYAGLVAEESHRAGDPRFDYLLGVCALDSGHVTRAIFALERAVATLADDALARAELGRAYLAAGEPQSARMEFEDARRLEMPVGAAAAIDRVLGIVNQIAPPDGLRFSGYVEVGAGYDSNVNSAANQGEFAIPAFGGVLFTTTSESQKQHDTFASAAGGASAQFGLGPAWKLVAAANLHGNFNRQVHDMNIDVLEASAGVNHVSGAHSQTVALQNGTVWVGSRGYRNANGVSAQWQSQLDAASQASAFGQWSRQEYAGLAERNTDRAVAGLGYARDFGTLGTLVYGSLYLADERARHESFDYFGHHATGVRLGVEHVAGPQTLLTFEWQHERRRYGGTEPLFDVARQDRQDDLTVQVRYGKVGHWQVVPQIHYTRAASNVVLYDYTRTVLQLIVRRDF